MSFFRFSALLLTLLYGCSNLYGCGDTAEKSSSTADSTAAIVLYDDAGRNISLEHQPRHIVPLAPSLTELLYAIGAASQVAAVSLADDYPPQIETLPKYSSFPMDYEALVAIKPDVLIATDVINNPKDAEQFTSLGLPIVYYSFSTWKDIPRVMRSLGKLTGRVESADIAADSLENKLKEITQKTASVQPVRTLFLIGSDQLYAFGKDNYIHEVITFAGGESLTATLDAVSPILSEEFILTSEPEVILGTFRSAEQLLTHHPALKNAPAIVNNRVCIIEASLVLRPGPRLLAGIQEMAECIHPTLFGAVDDMQPGFSETLR